MNDAPIAVSVGYEYARSRNGHIGGAVEVDIVRTRHVECSNSQENVAIRVTFLDYVAVCIGNPHISSPVEPEVMKIVGPFLSGLKKRGSLFRKELRAVPCPDEITLLIHSRVDEKSPAVGVCFG